MKRPAVYIAELPVRLNCSDYVCLRPDVWSYLESKTGVDFYVRPKITLNACHHLKNFCLIFLSHHAFTHAHISYFVLCKQADAINLMKNWIMRSINLISPEHIADQQECIKAWTYKFFIMSCHMWSQQMLGVDIICIVQWPTYVISWHQQTVKVLMWCNHWVKIIKCYKTCMTNTSDKCRTKVILYSAPNVENRMARTTVKTLANLAGNTRCNICRWVDIKCSAEQWNCWWRKSCSLNGVCARQTVAWETSEDTKTWLKTLCLKLLQFPWKKAATLHHLLKHQPIHNLHTEISTISLHQSYMPVNFGHPF